MGRHERRASRSRRLAAAALTCTLPVYVTVLARGDMTAGHRGLRQEAVSGFLPGVLLIAVVTIIYGPVALAGRGRHAGERHLRRWTSASTSSPGR